LKRNKIYIPSLGPSAWQQFLAEPDKQWRTGYSAKTLAHCWVHSDGLPPEIAALFPTNRRYRLQWRCGGTSYRCLV